MTKNLLEAGGTVLSAEANGSGPLKLRIRIIEGDIQGSSAYYPADVLREDGPKVFRKGTHMHLDHSTFWDRMEKPAGSLKDLSGFLDSDAVYESVNGVEGLYADAIVISQYAGFIDEVKENIGVSILAAASTEEGVSPKTGEATDIVTGLVGVLSVDFVTHPGANGRIIKKLTESAKTLWEPGFTAYNATHPPVEESAGNKQEEKRPMAEITEETAIALRDGITALTAALVAEAEARNAPPKEEDEPVNVVEAVLNVSAKLAESALPAAAQRRVMTAVRGGTELDTAITEEKAYIESLTTATKQTQESGSRAYGQLHVLGESKAGEPDDMAWASKYGKRAN